MWIQAPFLIILSLVTPTCRSRILYSPCLCGTSCLAERINSVPSGIFFFIFSPNLLATQPSHTQNNARPQVCCVPVPGPLPGGTCQNLVVSNTHLRCTPMPSRTSPFPVRRQRKEAAPGRNAERESGALA